MYYSDGWYRVIRDRISHEQAMADQRRLARVATKGPGLRARAARGLFSLAMAVENDEAWRAVWDRMGSSR